LVAENVAKLRLIGKPIEFGVGLLQGTQQRVTPLPPDSAVLVAFTIIKACSHLFSF
jgi:hypothetical protein